MTFVVDTNVAIVANGHASQADIDCQQQCVEWLESLVSEEVVAIDDEDLILEEYQGHLNFSGRPGVGDMFFKYLLDYRYWDDRVRMVPVTRSEDDRRGFEELPENTFDPSDRKFLAVAVRAEAVILNATDSDWDEHVELMDELGVEVKQLCPQHASKRSQHGQ